MNQTFSPIVTFFALANLALAVDVSKCTNATLRYISGGLNATIDSHTPGMLPDDGVAIGIEDGAIYNINGTLHMFPTEMHSGWVATRVVHWTAPADDRTNWTFVGGITDYGHGKCGIDDHHAEHWSGAPQWNDLDENWYLTVVGYNMNCDKNGRSASGGDGRILLYKSTTPGYKEGIGGPYVIDIEGEGLLPRPTSLEEFNENAFEDWGVPEGLDPFDPDEPFPERIIENGICSFAPVYKSALAEDPDDRLYTVYGTGWDIGAAYSDDGVRGSWYRKNKDGNHLPIGDWGDGGPENPQVTLTSSGIYVMWWAANLLQVEHGLAFAWSKDGVNWEDATGDGVHTGSAGYMLEVAPYPYQALRTPLGLVEHTDKPNFFTLFYTAFDNRPTKPDDIGGYASLFQTEFELVLTMEDE
mgnify:CR=1 FL=1|jgi:hypothetical protein|tara:strand:+ start:189 stop:1427 length:1239 start_codon:yes stop_codon:yes gene_type:complete